MKKKFKPQIDNKMRVSLFYGFAILRVLLGKTTKVSHIGMLC